MAVFIQATYVKKLGLPQYSSHQYSVEVSAESTDLTQLTLNELERSGHVHARREARAKQFCLVHDDWRFLATWKTPLGKTFPAWIPWAALFRWLEQFHALLDDDKLGAASPELQAIEWRRRLDYALFADVPDLAAFSFPIEARGADALAVHQDRFRHVIARLAAT